MMKESDILHEEGSYWISTAKAAGFKWKGYCVWQQGITHSTLVARIGFIGDNGLERAKQEIKKRIKHEQS